MTKSLIIGVAGGSGSGKTTLAKNLHLSMPNSVIISHDFYYKDYKDIAFEDRLQINYDHPNSFDTNLMVEQIPLRRRHTVRCRSFRCAWLFPAAPLNP